MIENNTRTYKVIDDFCRNESIKNGLMLVDKPTGSGKTHAVLDFIFNAACDDTFSDIKIFFITTLKKNLPSKDLEKRFINAGKADLFKEKFLFVDSNIDCVVNNLTDELEKTIPIEIRTSNIYKKIRADVKFLQYQTKSSKDDFNLKAVASSIKDNLRDFTEPEFRKHIQGLLSKKFTNAQSKIYAIKTDPEWQWVGKIYESVFMKERQIIFMSVDKFLVRSTTIVEPSSMLYNSSILNNALIFIDEVDATKETILRNIVKSGLRDRIDYLLLYREIFAALKTNKFPRKLTTPSIRRLSGKYKDQSLQSVIDRISEIAEEYYDRYSLQYSHKTVTDLIDSTRNFLFQDHRYTSILEDGMQYVVTSRDDIQQINSILFSNEKPPSDNNIELLLGQLRGFITYFSEWCVYVLANNYLQCKTEQRQDGDDEFTLEAAIRSVLTEFSLSELHKNFITSQILIASHYNNENVTGSEYDLSFYQRGFRYYAFVDESIHDMRSRIMMYGFKNTAEKIFLKFCERAKVIGISATATVPSIIGNYDLDYFKIKLQDHYVELTSDDRAALAEEFRDSCAGYNDIDIKVELISDSTKGEYSALSWMQVFDDMELAEDAYNYLEQHVLPDKDNFYQNRYLRISRAYKEFLAHSDIKSFLCVLTKHPKIGDIKLDLNILYDLFKRIHLLYPSKYTPKQMVCLLDGEEYESKKNTIQTDLKNGKKLFVISVYQTIGAGQNLQYDIPTELNDSLVSINSFPSSGEKDFDAIYLDKPTNVVVNLGEDMDEESFVRYLFQTEYLQENAEISAYEARDHIKKAFKTYCTTHVPKDMRAADISKCKSTMLQTTKILIQAMGRICRTNQKQKTIYIFADKRIAESIDPSIRNKILLNPEFEALLDKIAEIAIPDIRQKSLEDAASLLSVKANKYINNMIREKWTDTSVEQWKQLRQLVLKKPTMSQEEIDNNFMARNFYIQLPDNGTKYWYDQAGDYNDINISFTGDPKCPYEVSEAAARLNQFMAIPVIKAYFEEKGYATSFASNAYIMSPALFNNIYKGILGEEIGRFIIETYMHVPLEEIPELEHFELFDFKVKEKSVFIDFKHWMESTHFNAQEMLIKIADKAALCNAKCVIIINVIAENKYDTNSTTINGIRIIEVPALMYHQQNKTSSVGEVWKMIMGVVDEFID